jgi:hypothetical protein
MKISAMNIWNQHRHRNGVRQRQPEENQKNPSLCAEFGTVPFQLKIVHFANLTPPSQLTHAPTPCRNTCKFTSEQRKLYVQVYITGLILEADLKH